MFCQVRVWTMHVIRSLRHGLMFTYKTHRPSGKPFIRFDYPKSPLICYNVHVYTMRRDWMKKRLLTAVTVFSVCAFAAGAGTQVQAFSLGSVIKGGAIGVVVDKYGDSINSFLNKLLKQNNLDTSYATKVVPIVSLGKGSRVGAAQVTGPTAEVERVKAVAQVEGSFNNIARVKGLVPVDSANPSGASRIQGVGVSAIIDLKI